MYIIREHGDKPCKKFAANKCTFGNRCLFKHLLKPINIVPQQQRDFHERPTGRIGSPGVQMPTMSQHLQNQNQPHSPQEMVQQQVNIINMIPQVMHQMSQVQTILAIMSPNKL